MIQMPSVSIERVLLSCVTDQESIKLTTDVESGNWVMRI